MGISAVGSSVAPAAIVSSSPVKAASDGDSAAVEAAESAGTKKAEVQGGGFASKASPQNTPLVSSVSGTIGGVNKLV